MADETTPQMTRKRRRHWIAGTFYLLVAVVGVIIAFSGSPSTLFITVIAGLYSIYLFRGGRFVIFFW